MLQTELVFMTRHLVGIATFLYLQSVTKLNPVLIIMSYVLSRHLSAVPATFNNSHSCYWSFKISFKLFVCFSSSACFLLFAYIYVPFCSQTLSPLPGWLLLGTAYITLLTDLLLLRRTKSKSSFPRAFSIRSPCFVMRWLPCWYQQAYQSRKRCFLTLCPVWRHLLVWSVRWSCTWIPGRGITVDLCCWGRHVFLRSPHGLGV